MGEGRGVRGWSRGGGRKVICRYFVDQSIGGLCGSPGLFITCYWKSPMWLSSTCVREDIQILYTMKYAFDVVFLLCRIVSEW